MNARKVEPLAWLILLIGAGALARFWDLSWQFSHNDDIGVAKTILDARMPGSLRALLAIPRQWTYAPVQFFLTFFLVRPDQGYREILFWGRLPSCLAAIGGLGAFAFFYRRFREDWFPRMLPALALLAFSWQFIIYSKHMSNYAIGVTACIGMMILLLGLVQKPSLSWKGALGAGLVLSFLSHVS